MLTFEEFIDKIDEQTMTRFTAKDGADHIGKRVVLGKDGMTKRSGILQKYKYIADKKRHSLTIGGMELHVHGDHPLHVYEEALNERKIVRRIRNGKVQRKLICGKGMKNVGNRCVRMSSTERQHRRVAVRKAARTRRAHKSRQRRANFKRQRSLLRRRAMGIH